MQSAKVTVQEQPAKDSNEEVVKVKTTRSKLPCSFWIEGRCHKVLKLLVSPLILQGENCTFSHDIPQRKHTEICKFYRSGFCDRGDNCIFSHGGLLNLPYLINIDLKAEPCAFFKSGKCKNGDQCRFGHFLDFSSIGESKEGTVQMNSSDSCPTETHKRPPPEELSAPEAKRPRIDVCALPSWYDRPS